MRNPIAVLVDPGGWFEGMPERPSVRGALAVVAAVAGTHAAVLLLRAFENSIAYRGDTTISGFNLNQGVFGLSFWPEQALRLFLRIGVGTIGIFVLYVGVVHLLSVVWGGEGSFRQAVAIVGWGYAPLIIGGLIEVVLMYLVLQDVPAPQFPTEEFQWSLQMRSHPLGELRRVAWLSSWTPVWFYTEVTISTPFTVWAGFLWGIGVSRVRRVSVRRGLVIGAATVVVGFLVESFVPGVYESLILFDAGEPILG